MKKILLLGATGMAGHVAYHYLKETGRYKLVAVVYRTLLTPDSIIVDVNNWERLAELVKEQKPDIILNCIGVLIAGAKKDPANAIYINAYLPHRLKKLADEMGATLIHISTDCVFSGKKGNYAEDDFKDADDIYGRSKALGEIVDEHHLTLRTSIVGPELKSNGEGLFHWFMHQEKQCLGYKTAIWGGVTTLELAKVIDYVIQHPVTGLVQVSNGEGINKFDLLTLFKDTWHMPIEIIPVDKNGVDKSIARSRRLPYEVPSYKQMIGDLKLWMERHASLYKANYNI